MELLVDGWEVGGWLGWQWQMGIGMGISNHLGRGSDQRPATSKWAWEWALNELTECENRTRHKTQKIIKQKELKQAKNQMKQNRILLYDHINGIDLAKKESKCVCASGTKRESGSGRGRARGIWIIY